MRMTVLITPRLGCLQPVEPLRAATYHAANTTSLKPPAHEALAASAATTVPSGCGQYQRLSTDSSDNKAAKAHGPASYCRACPLHDTDTTKMYETQDRWPPDNSTAPAGGRVLSGLFSSGNMALETLGTRMQKVCEAHVAVLTLWSFGWFMEAAAALRHKVGRGLASKFLGFEIGCLVFLASTLFDYSLSQRSRNCRDFRDRRLEVETKGT